MYHREVVRSFCVRSALTSFQASVTDVVDRHLLETLGRAEFGWLRGLLCCCGKLVITSGEILLGSCICFESEMKTSCQVEVLKRPVR
jgi:hypothetical protein